MNTKEIFAFVQRKIHTTIIATVDEINLPVTCVIDIMLAKDEKLYFITAKGKSFYERLISKEYLSLTGLIGEDTMSSTSVSIRGYVKDIGSDLLDEVFEENSYMKKIYPSIESRKALTVFEIYKGDGEYFDLSQKPIERYSFTFGGETLTKNSRYSINNSCTSCGDCLSGCPTSCIEKGTPFKIHDNNCLHCGNCLDACSYGAVIKS